ncbi:MAG: hypothetical protein KKH01_08360 [Firmicutes bacterium]|nr:hypothetical protein [Bacillota bacterium]
MKYCKSCHVHYDTDLEHCILCNGELEQEGDQISVYKFSDITKRSASRFFNRFFIFINVISALICLYLDLISGLPLTWSLVVTITNIYVIVMFTVLAVPTLWTSKMTKSIIVTVMAIILIGLAIRDYSWAIDFVFPIAVGTNIFLISLLIITNKKKWYDYFAGLTIITLIGLIPGLFNLIHLTTQRVPSFICFSYALITLLGIIFLPSKSSREEFKRRFHV